MIKSTFILISLTISGVLEPGVYEMLGVFVRCAYDGLRTVTNRTSHYQDELNQSTRHRRRIDLCALEDRLFFSADPLSALVDVASDPALEDTDQITDQQLIDEDYSDAVADLHDPQSGIWEVVNGRYQVTPNSDAVSTFLLDQPLPENLEITATFNADDVSSQYKSNAFVVFDYQGPTDFKFAGSYVGSDQWIIGHRSSSGWIIDAQVKERVDALTDYNVRVTIVNDSLVTVYANGDPKVTHSYSSSVTDGEIGLGTRNAVTRFDDVGVRSLVSDTVASEGELPYSEDFDDQLADHLEPKSGSWLLIDAVYQVSPEMGGDGISSLLVGEEVSDNVEIAVTFNADALIPGRFSNGFIIFDYNSATDFKYAGGFLGRGEWVIGHRTVDAWVDDAALTASLNAFTDYDIRVVVENGSDVSLYQADTLVVSHSFSESVTDGAIGLGSYDSITRFDDFSVVDQTPVSDISAVLQEGDLIVSGDSGGEVQIVAIEDDTFQILDHGRLIFTVEGVTGDLNIELGDADDLVTLDLRGHSFHHNVAVNLGDGDNALEIIDGSIGGHLIVSSADGRDEIAISDNVTVCKHTRVTTGAGDDSFAFFGATRRGVFVKSGEGDDTLVLSGSVIVGSFVNAGDGDDSIDISPDALGRITIIKLGEGTDSLNGETSEQHVVVIKSYGDDHFRRFGWSRDRHHDNSESTGRNWKRQHIRNASDHHSQAAIIAKRDLVTEKSPRPNGVDFHSRKLR